MFEQSFLSGDKKLKSWTMFGAFTGHSLVAGALAMAPALIVQPAPPVRVARFLLAPPLPPPLRARGEVKHRVEPVRPPVNAPRTDEMEPAEDEPVKAVKLEPRQFDMARLSTPRAIPNNISIIHEPEVQLSYGTNGGVDGGVTEGIPGGAEGGVRGGVLGGIVGLPGEPEPAPAPPAVESPKRIRVGGDVQQGRIIRKVVPDYPYIARQARVQGVVRLTAVIDEEGKITNVQVVSGHPMLVPAAVNAVKKWRYTPTLLNGEPVEVVTDVEVRFVLR